MTKITCFAPAKLNLTLEVLGKRPDGYHEIRSVITTVDLCDRVTVENGQGLIVTADEDYDHLGMPVGPRERNTVDVALGLMAIEWQSRQQPVRLPLKVAVREAINSCRLCLHKRIPPAAGLGGGSSDAAAALQALNVYWSLALGTAQLIDLASQIGSDCPFFINGGMQVARGRGELLRSVVPPPPAWFCVVRPPVFRRQKTAALYSLLREIHYTSGEQTESLASAIDRQAGRAIQTSDLSNVFDAVADEAFGSLADLRASLRDRGAEAVHLCGSGPALYGLFSGEASARAAEDAFKRDGYASWAVRGPATSSPAVLIE